MLAELVRATATQTLASRGLDAAMVPAQVGVRRPRNPEHGDYATSVALQIAESAGLSPRELAEAISERLAAADGISSAEVAGPGFVNVRLAAPSRAAVVRRVLEAADDFGGGEPVAVTVPPDLHDVQYAHARLAALQRHAADLGLSAGGADLALLTDPREVDLIHTIGEFPRVASTGEPHRVARYLEELVGAYYRFEDGARVLPRGDEDPTPLTFARLALCAATRQILANGLGLLGVAAPERM